MCGVNSFSYAGGYDGDSELYYSATLQFEPSTLSWSPVAEMERARSEHGASVVNVEEVEQLCVETQKRKIGIYWKFMF